MSGSIVDSRVRFEEAMVTADRLGLTSVQIMALLKHCRESMESFEEAVARVVATCEASADIAALDAPIKPPAPTTGPPKGRLDGRRRR